MFLYFRTHPLFTRQKVLLAPAKQDGAREEKPQQKRRTGGSFRWFHLFVQSCGTVVHEMRWITWETNNGMAVDVDVEVENVMMKHDLNLGRATCCQIAT